MDTYRKILYSTTIGTTIICSYICFNAFRPNAYKITIENKPVAYIEDIDKFQRIQSSLQEELKKRFGTVKLNSNINAEMATVDKSVFTSEEDVKNNILANSKIEVSAVKILSDNRQIALVASETEGKATLEYIKKYYISKCSGLVVSESKIKNKITYVPQKVQLSQVDKVENAANKIISSNSSSEKAGKAPILCLQIKATTQSKETIAPATVVTSSNELLMGQSKVSNQGSNGTKTVTTTVSIENTTIISKVVTGEKIEVAAVNKVIVKGSQSNTVGNLLVSRGVFATPSRGVITSAYGMRWGKMHYGIDVAGKIGDPIHAAMNGVVCYAQWEEGYGNVVKIDHGDGLITIYGHCSALNVSKGKAVKKGDKIAAVGSTGRSTGPHLHFEVRQNGNAVSPLKYLQ